MKYKRISLAVIAATIVGGILLQDIDMKNYRYHQHMEALQKPACTEHGDDVFCTHLPLMQITIEDSMPDPYLTDADGNILVTENGHKMKNQATTPAEIFYFDSAESNNHLTDEAEVSSLAEVRIRGNMSRDFDKKGYAIEFKKDDMTENRKVELSGMTADSDWVLHGPFMDKTLIRNYLCYNLSGEIMDYAPNVRFCELFINEEYMGVYLLVEDIKFNQDGRVTMEKSDPDMKETSYILQADRGADTEWKMLDTFGTQTFITGYPGRGSGQMEIVYPSATLTEEQKKYIGDDFARFEKALFSFDYDKKDRGYRNYIDVDSFVEYFLINELTLNYDACGLSTYLYKDLGGKLHFCVWDFNSAFDNYTESMTSPQTFALQRRMWYQYLMKDEDFVERVIRKYERLRKDCMDETYLLQYVDDTVAYLGPAIERNYEKWGYSFGKESDLLIPEERNPRSYEEAVNQLKTCISERIAYMDENIERLRLVGHESLNKKFRHDDTDKGGFS